MAAKAADATLAALTAPKISCLWLLHGRFLRQWPCCSCMQCTQENKVHAMDCHTHGQCQKLCNIPCIAKVLLVSQEPFQSAWHQMYFSAWVESGTVCDEGPAANPAYAVI